MGIQNKTISPACKASIVNAVLDVGFFAVQLCRSGEHAYDLLTVNESMSIKSHEKTGSTPGIYRYANTDVTELRHFHLIVQCLEEFCHTHFTSLSTVTAR